LGEIAALRGDDAQAVASTLRLSSGWADGWVNPGVTRYRQGGVGAATEGMRQAPKAVAGHPAAAANLA
jgi:hypothetical protein